MPRRTLLLAAALAALIAAGPVAAHDGAHDGAHSGPADDYVFALPEPGSYSLPAIRPAAGGPVLDEDGHAHDLGNLVRGQVTVLAFIYTQCGDVCPTATLRLAQLHDLAARDARVAARLRLLTMSFDAENDTPDVMREHAAQWRGDTGTAPDWQFLTAPDAASLQPVMAAYDQTVGRKPDPNDPTGALNHILRVFLVDAGGTVRNIYSLDFLEMVEIGLPQDPGQAGKSQAADMVLMLAGYVVKAERESGDKVTRAEPVAAQAEAGNLDILEGDWNEAFIEEATNFPASKFKDQVDALSGAFNRLIGATVFATPEEFIRAPVSRIPETWTRVAVLDVDTSRIGITWAAHDRTGDVAMIYDCVVTPRSDLSLLAATLRDRGPWIPVLMDAEARKRPKAEGLRIAERLNELGVDVYCAHAETGAMVEEIANRLSTGRLRVHDHLEEWFAGYRRYRRDEKGEITETDDHLMRATGLMVVHGLGLSISENRAASEAEEFDPLEDERVSGRLGVTGY